MEEQTREQGTRFLSKKKHAATSGRPVSLSLDQKPGEKRGARSVSRGPQSRSTSEKHSEAL